jgi:hypothetical protein
MKYLKIMLFAVIMASTFASADAQVVVKLGGGPYYHGGRHWHHRAPYWRGHHRYYRYY